MHEWCSNGSDCASISPTLKKSEGAARIHDFSGLVEGGHEKIYLCLNL
jgi:hypothetical protein